MPTTLFENNFYTLILADAQSQEDDEPVYQVHDKTSGKITYSTPIYPSALEVFHNYTLLVKKYITSITADQPKTKGVSPIRLINRDTADGGVKNAWDEYTNASTD